MRILLSILTYIGILVFVFNCLGINKKSKDKHWYNQNKKALNLIFFAFAQTNIQVKKQDGTIGSPDPNPNGF
ncbi:MAG TPA: hypothetical protein PLG41_07740 [Leptospiraceae bacterium]|nr:hypothetical protein [Leptospiraceae bacterium]